MSEIQSIGEKIDRYSWPLGGICSIAALDFATGGQLPPRFYDHVQTVPPTKNNLIPLYTDVITQIDGHEISIRPPLTQEVNKKIAWGAKAFTSELQEIDFNRFGIHRSLVLWETNNGQGHAVTLFNGPGNSIGIFNTNTDKTIQRISPKKAQRRIIKTITKHTLWLIRWE